VADLAVSGLWLVSIILKVFSNLDDSAIRFFHKQLCLMIALLSTTDEN